MTSRKQTYRIAAAIVALIAFVFITYVSPDRSQIGRLNSQPQPSLEQQPTQNPVGGAAVALEVLEVKGRAPKTGYARTQFGDGWLYSDGCDTRNRILSRDLTSTTKDDRCRILTGTLHDPYTAVGIAFTRGASSSADVQIDHVVALSNAWQTGAQQLSQSERVALANDPLELLAVDGLANQQKSDGDAASWLPSNKAFRCQYVARQIAVKQKYKLWVTAAEKQAMLHVLIDCPAQQLPSVS